MSEPKKDDVTGVETTGHEWDGIQELNNPLPRWWLWTFYACIAWAVIFTIAMPAWPMVNRATAGFLGFSTRGQAEKAIADADAALAPQRAALVAADMSTLATDDPALHGFAVSAGAAVFKNNCSQCHGSGAAGAKGYPNLLDDDWLWGGTMEDIVTTVTHGIRNEDDADARYSEMPAFGDDYLTDEEIATLVAQVQAISTGTPVAEGPGADLFLDNCAACHGEDGKGDRYQGAPNLTDAIWLYGNDTETLTKTISEGPFGVMPSWIERLGEANVRAVAAYVHQLGGGEAAETDS